MPFWLPPSVWSRNKIAGCLGYGKFHNSLDLAKLKITFYSLDVRVPELLIKLAIKALGQAKYYCKKVIILTKRFMMQQRKIGAPEYGEELFGNQPPWSCYLHKYDWFIKHAAPECLVLIKPNSNSINLIEPLKNN